MGPLVLECWGLLSLGDPPPPRREVILAFARWLDGSGVCEGEMETGSWLLGSHSGDLAILLGRGKPKPFLKPSPVQGPGCQAPTALTWLPVKVKLNDLT